MQITNSQGGHSLPQKVCNGIRLRSPARVSASAVGCRYKHCRAHMCVCRCRCMCVCMCVCICACVCVCVCVGVQCMFICVFARTRAHICALASLHLGSYGLKSLNASSTSSALRCRNMRFAGGIRYEGQRAFNHFESEMF